ncbi:MAG: VacJ family lipoprotein [Gammaproteobacteria bacterium]|nr:VacJ family lipoprotein [Gammaproteobacteria bacterium]
MFNLNSVKSSFKSLRHLLILSIAVIVLPACSAIQPQESVDAETPVHPVDSIVKDDVEYAVDVYDPWEGMNRGTYIFNAKLDRYVMVPVTNVYRDYVPFFLRQGINNFFSNIASFNHTVNSAFQLNGETTVNNGLRFISNTTMGIGGMFDIATGMGFPEIKEDFGQTLGYWGVGDGPYVVLPLFGPSNLRDTGGLLVDYSVTSWFTDDVLGMSGDGGWLAFYYIMTGVNTRAQTSFNYYQSGSPFEYETIRWLYTSGRQAMIAR